MLHAIQKFPLSGMLIERMQYYREWWWKSCKLNRLNISIPCGSRNEKTDRSWVGQRSVVDRLPLFWGEEHSSSSLFVCSIIWRHSSWSASFYLFLKSQSLGGKARPNISIIIFIRWPPPFDRSVRKSSRLMRGDTQLVGEVSQRVARLKIPWLLF